MQYSSSPAMEIACDAYIGITKVAFSPKFRAFVKRSKICSAQIEIPSRDDTLRALSLVRKTMPVADAAVVSAIYDHNPECFRIVWQGTLTESPMMTYLPLSAEGAAALVDGRFNPQCPELGYICRPDETAEAIYLWLMFTPGKMLAGLRLFCELEQYGAGCPIFSRPAHRGSMRILTMAGLVPAQDYFPAASADLMFTLTAMAESDKNRSNTAINIRIVRTFEDMAKVFSVRTATYISEQLCSYEEEFDGNDFSATHLLGEVNGEPAGCVRIRYFGDFAKIERLAVRSEFRRSRLMRCLASEALDFCAQKGFRRIYGHVRRDLVPAWERMFGATPVPGRSEFSFSDVSFREMEFALPPHRNAIRFGADPLLTIRPEGDWDRLGPVERAQFKQSTARRSRINALKTFKGGREFFQ